MVKFWEKVRGSPSSRELKGPEVDVYYTGDVVYQSESYTPSSSLPSSFLSSHDSASTLKESLEDTDSLLLTSCDDTSLTGSKGSKGKSKDKKIKDKKKKDKGKDTIEIKEEDGLIPYPDVRSSEVLKESKENMKEKEKAKMKDRNQEKDKWVIHIDAAKDKSALKSIQKKDGKRSTLERKGEFGPAGSRDSMKESRKDKKKEKEERKRDEKEAKRREEEARKEAKRLEEEAKRREEEAKIEAKRREEEAKVEAKRREEEAKIEAKRREEEAKIEAKRRDEQAKIDAKRREEEAKIEAKRREEEREREEKEAKRREKELKKKEREQKERDEKEAKRREKELKKKKDKEKRGSIIKFFDNNDKGQLPPCPEENRWSLSEREKRAASLRYGLEPSQEVTLREKGKTRNDPKRHSTSEFHKRRSKDFEKYVAPSKLEVENFRARSSSLRTEYRGPTRYLVHVRPDSTQPQVIRKPALQNVPQFSPKERKESDLEFGFLHKNYLAPNSPSKVSLAPRASEEDLDASFSSKKKNRGHLRSDSGSTITSSSSKSSGVSGLAPMVPVKEEVPEIVMKKAYSKPTQEMESRIPSVSFNQQNIPRPSQPESNKPKLPPSESNIPRIAPPEPNIRADSYSRQKQSKETGIPKLNVTGREPSTCAPPKLAPLLSQPPEPSVKVLSPPIPKTETIDVPPPPVETLRDFESEVSSSPQNQDFNLNQGNLDSKLEYERAKVTSTLTRANNLLENALDQDSNGNNLTDSSFNSDGEGSPQPSVSDTQGPKPLVDTNDSKVRNSQLSQIPIPNKISETKKKPCETISVACDLNGSIETTFGADINFMDSDSPVEEHKVDQELMAPKELVVELPVTRSVETATETAIPLQDYQKKHADQKTTRKSSLSQIKGAHQPDLVSNSIGSRAHAAQEISRLEALCEARTKELNYTKMQLKAGVQGFDAMAVMVQYLTSELDAFSMPELQKKLDLMDKEMLTLQTNFGELKGEKDSLEATTHDLIQSHKGSVETMKDEHKTQLNSLEDRLGVKHEEHIQRLHDQHSEEVKTLKSYHDKSFSEMNNEHEAYMQELEQTHNAKLLESGRKHEDHLEELQKQHEAKLHEITHRFEDIKVTLSDKVYTLKAECDELRNRSHMYEEALQRDTNMQVQPGETVHDRLQKLIDEKARFDPAPQEPSSIETDDVLHELHKSYILTHDFVARRNSYALGEIDSPKKLALLPYRDLPQEIESLKTVLEMKNQEIHDLRRGKNEMEKLLEDLPPAKERIKMLEQKIENLEAIINIKSDYEKQLAEKHSVLIRRYDRESKANKRLSMDNEELLYRLTETDGQMAEVLNPTPTPSRKIPVPCRSPSSLSDVSSSDPTWKRPCRSPRNILSPGSEEVAAAISQVPMRRSKSRTNETSPFPSEKRTSNNFEDEAKRYQTL